MGPLIPVVLAIAAWGCSSNGVDEDPIVADSGTGGKDSGLQWPEASSYSDLPHVDLPNSPDSYSPDTIAADLFAKDSGDISEVAGDAKDTQADVPVTSKFCEPKVSLPASCGITEIAAGDTASCLIKSGTVYCAGKITASSDPFTPLFNSAAFVAVPSLAGAKHVAVGGAHICAIMPGNDVKCLGQNIWGQLGDGTMQDATDAVAVSDMGNAVAISLGSFHSLGVDASGKIFAWGFNSGGQLGLAAMTSTATTPLAVAIPTNTAVVSAAAGALHSVAVLSDGTAYAWGNNALFPLGVGATGKILTPMPMQNAKLGLGAAAGADSTHFLDRNCAVSSVGAGGLGQLGLGTSADASILTPVPSLTDIAAIAAGGQHACAITQAGALFCWGENISGNPIPTPVQVSGVQPVVQTALGTNHSLVLNVGCQVLAWGRNTVGQLGTGNTTDAPSPTSVTIN